MSKLIHNLDSKGFLRIENDFATASIALIGGHVTSFIPKHDKRERFWLSDKAIYDGSRSTRGGIPVCWPWFADHTEEGFPFHGFVRTQTWECIHSADHEFYTEIILVPENCQAEGLDGQASLRLILKIGTELSVLLETNNIGTTNFTYTCALHTYFAVSDIRSTTLTGLSGQYLDKTQNFALLETPDNYQFSQETDRIHLNPVDKVTIIQNDSQTQIGSSGHDSLVVWNPWSENAKLLTDMQDDDYQNMLCVETAITQGQELKPGESHCLEQIIK